MEYDFDIYIDGACRGNPGEAAIGVVIKKNGKLVKEISRAIGQATNNIAEYTALISSLQQALILKADKIRIFTDSELVYHQIKGTYKVRNENIKRLHEQAQDLWQGFSFIDILNIPREQNQEADRLASDAVERRCQEICR